MSKKIKQEYFKSVTFGGYDRLNVIERFEELNNRIIELENELETTKKELSEMKAANEQTEEISKNTDF